PNLHIARRGHTSVSPIKKTNVSVQAVPVSPVSKRDVPLFAQVFAFDETTEEGAVENVVVQLHRQSFEVNDVDGVTDDVARMAAAEVAATLMIVAVDEIFHQSRRRL